MKDSYATSLLCVLWLGLAFAADATGKEIVFAEALTVGSMFGTFSVLYTYFEWEYEIARYRESTKDRPR